MRKSLTALALVVSFLAVGTVAHASVLPGGRPTRTVLHPVSVAPGTLIGGNYGGQLDVTANSVAGFLANGYVCLGTGTHSMFGRITATYTCLLPA